jgi:signal peptidase II
MLTQTQKRILPLSLSVFVILADQLTKLAIVRNFPLGNQKPLEVFGNDLVLIYHVRNKAIAFSLGAGVPESLRPVLFIIVPLAVLGFLLFYFLKTDEFTFVQRWAVAGILGGGIGNLADRIFRPDGVVDFVSVKFFGLLGFERWPTFNAADSAVVVSVIAWLIAMIVQGGSAQNAKPARGGEAEGGPQRTSDGPQRTNGGA